MNYAVIMAGGGGVRFWPASRVKTPKQFLSIATEKSMIKETVERLLPLIPLPNIFVVGNRIHKEVLKEQLPDFSPEQFILEPYGRNTAAAIGVAAKVLIKKDPDATLVVLPSDHLIRNVQRFYTAVKDAIQLANDDNALVTIGIKPSRPETGYGYIQVDEDHPVEGREGAFRVKTFAEKPNIETAIRFVKAGDFAWNSGMFIWRADTILDEIQHYIPDLAQELDGLSSAIFTDMFDGAMDVAYARMPAVSIDYGIMEKTNLVYVIKADLGWSDVGSWDEVAILAEKNDKGNSKIGSVFVQDVNNSYIQSSEKTIAVVGLDDLIVIETKDSILICKKGSSQHVRGIVDQLKLSQNEHLL